jgi:hypothetical protein
VGGCQLSLPGPDIAEDLRPSVHSKALELEYLGGEMQGLFASVCLSEWPDSARRDEREGCDHNKVYGEDLMELLRRIVRSNLRGVSVKRDEMISR